MKKMLICSSAALFAVFFFSGDLRNAGVPAASAADDTPAVLSAQEIDGLKTEATDDKTGNKLIFQCAVTPNTKNKSGKAAFQVIAYVLETQKPAEAGAQSRPKLVRTGNANFYLLDSSGKVAVGPMSQPLDKMCPS